LCIVAVAFANTTLSSRIASKEASSSVSFFGSVSVRIDAGKSGTDSFAPRR
jgi:hypothetical protein